MLSRQHSNFDMVNYGLVNGRKHHQEKNGSHHGKKSKFLMIPSILLLFSIFFVSCAIIFAEPSGDTSSITKREAFEPQLRYKRALDTSFLTKRNPEYEYEERRGRRRRRPRRRGNEEGGGGAARRRPMRRRPPPPPTTTEEPSTGSKFAKALYSIWSSQAESEPSKSSSWFGWGSEESTTAAPRKMVRRKRRRYPLLSTESPDYWYHYLNPYKYVSDGDVTTIEPPKSLPQKVASAVAASHYAFKDNLAYALVPGLQLIPFLAGIDAFTAALITPEKKKEEPVTHRSGNFQYDYPDYPEYGRVRRRKKPETKEDEVSAWISSDTVKTALVNALFPVVPLYNWSSAMIEAGQRGKAVQKSAPTTPSPNEMVSSRDYLFNPTTFAGIMESFARYLGYATNDIADFLTRMIEQPISAVREGIKSALWTGSTTFLTTFSPQYSLVVGVAKGAATTLQTLFGFQQMLTNVPSIMKMHPFYWIEKAIRFSLDPYGFSGFNSDGVDTYEIDDDSSATPRTVRVPRKYDPSLLLKFTPNYWVYYLWTHGWKALNPFTNDDLLDLDNEITEDDGGGTSVLIKMNPFYTFYVIVKSTIKNIFGWGTKNPAEDNFKIDSWLALGMAFMNPYKWLYAGFQMTKSLAKLVFDPLGLSFFWDIYRSARNPDDRYTFVIRFLPGYWMYQMYMRLVDPFGNTVEDPEAVHQLGHRGHKYVINGHELPEYTVAIQPYYLLRIYVWPIFRFIFDPARMYTTEYIPEDLDWIIDPVIDVLNVLKSKHPTSTTPRPRVTADIPEYEVGSE